MKKHFYLIGVIFLISCTLEKNDAGSQSKVQPSDSISIIDTSETIIVEKLQNAIAYKNYFFYNCYYGMSESEYYDSIANIPLYQTGYSGNPATLRFELGKEAIRFIPTPDYYNGKLRSFSLVSDPYDLNISSDLKEYSILDWKPRFFSLPFLPSGCDKKIISLYTEKYGTPQIEKKNINEDYLDPDLKKYIDDKLKFESLEGTTEANVRARLESDAYKIYGKCVEKVQPEKYIFQSKEGNLITIVVENRINISQLNYNKERGRIKSISINYKPKQELEIEKERILKDLELRNYQEKQEMEKLKQAEKDLKIII